MKPVIIPPQKQPYQFGLASLMWLMAWTGALVVAWQNGLLAWEEMLLPQFVVIGALIVALPALAFVLRNR